MRKKKKLLSQICIPHLLIIILTVVTVSLFASYSFKKYYIGQMVSNLETKDRLIEKLVERRDSSENLETFCKELGASIATRVTIILPSGKVICDSNTDQEKMENHAARREVKQALTGRTGVDTHYSKELLQEMIYVAVPIYENNEIKRIIRTSTPITQISTVLNSIYLKSALGGVVIAILAVLMSYLLTRRISKSVELVKEGARRYADGDFEYRINAPDIAEMGSLVDTLNKMALQLLRLETIRSDFVTNVSHELMTPITSIKGFVETLRDGAIKDPEKNRQFLEIIAKHAERLGAIVEDLLNLSRVEQGTESGKINFEEVRFKNILESAISACAHKTAEKNIQIKLECPKNIIIMAHQNLLESAVINLIDNAIKYSEKKGTITVACGESEEGVFIKVIDAGCGISSEHLHRIFERFYMVDKARGRQLGGTGLGLAIVKHIVIAHGGHIHVESELGKGSTFTIYLPLISHH